MILTCPSCGTQYVVKDGAIPPHGRQVRCASCKHSWHQDPEDGAPPEETETIAEAALIEPRSGPEAEQRAYESAALGSDAPPPDTAVDEAGNLEEETRSDELAAVPPGYAPVEPPATPADALVEDEPGAPEAPLETGDSIPQDELRGSEAGIEDDEFSPFAPREVEPARRSRLLSLLLVALLIAAAAAAFWFLAPADWKQRLGVADSGETPLQLMMTHSDLQKLSSGNELLAVSGRVINPTDEAHDVPPIQAQLRSSSGRLVYSWTIAPPARTLPPGASATFNSAEVNVPAGGDELTITLGSSGA